MLQQNTFNYSIPFDQQPCKKVYARLTALSQNELPLETFEGIITSGNLNMDGQSSIRRTCSLNINTIIDGTDITDAYWALTHKFKLEIGISANDLNSEGIQWIKQGIFIINNFSKNKTINNISISISGQDKMCKLNGTIGGSFPHEIDFGQIENVQEDGTIIIEKTLIHDIIQQSVQQYGKELIQNIIINDLPDHGLELLEYRGSTPMYLFVQSTDARTVKAIDAFVFDENMLVYTKMPKDETTTELVETQIALKNLPQYWSMNSLDLGQNKSATACRYNENDEDIYYVVKLEFGDTIGYRKTPLVYAGELKCKAGENVDSLLKKIQAMLGEYEYFYDVDGRFIFQKKKTFLSELFSPVNGDIIEPLIINMPYSYIFNDLKLFTSIGTNPSIDKIKNDFVFWGQKKSNSNKINIHVRYAIDKKPKMYISPWAHYEAIMNLSLMYTCQKIDNNYYFHQHDGIVYHIKELPSIIYSYAETDRLYTETTYDTLVNGDKFYINMAEQEISEAITISKDNNKLIDIVQWNANDTYISFDLAEAYYKQNGEYIQASTLNEIPKYKMLTKKIDENKIYSNQDYDWRELIYRMAQDQLEHSQDIDFLSKIAKANYIIDEKTGKKSFLYLNGITGYEQYYADMLGFWRLLYDPEDFKNCFTTGDISQRYWNKSFYASPESAIFWFDFLDAGGAEISKYAVPNIGMRQKVTSGNSKSTTSIFYNNTPTVLFTKPGEATEKENGYTLLQLPQSIEKLVAVSSQGVSLIEEVNSAIYNNVIISETIALSTIPIYHLQPNTRIYVEGIGDLIITRISCALGHNGTMSITCQKPLSRIY